MQKRDMLFYKLAVKDFTNREAQTKLLQNSLDNSTNALKDMSATLTRIGTGISSGLEVLARSFMPQTAAQVLTSCRRF